MIKNSTIVTIMTTNNKMIHFILDDTGLVSIVLPNGEHCETKHTALIKLKHEIQFAEEFYWRSLRLL